MDRRLATLMALLPLALALPPSTAQDPLDSCYYVDVGGELYLTKQGTAYVESNGVPGLQRGGVTLLGDAEWCQVDHLIPDTAVL